jgi:hypothetical protein
MGDRAPGLVVAMAALVSGCALVVPPPLPDVAGDAATRDTDRPRAAVPRPPARWTWRFCDAQIWVARALLRIDQAGHTLAGDADREAIEDAGDDVADAAGRALDFLGAVPDWTPAMALVRAERSMLAVVVREGDGIERDARSGSIDQPAARARLHRLDRAARDVWLTARRAQARGVPCARPAIPRTPTTLAEALDGGRR